MSQFDSIIASIKNESYPHKKQLLEYTLRLIQMIQSKKKSLTAEDKAALLEYAYSEVDTFIVDIPKAATYKEKDLMIACEDHLLGIIWNLCPNPRENPPDKLAKIRMLVEIVEKERYIERALDNLFSAKTITEDGIDAVLSLVNQTEEEYHKGALYSGLVHYKDNVSKLSKDAKARITDHLTQEFKRYLNGEKLTEDCVNNLEVMVDISRYFADDAIIGLLQEVLQQGYHNVNYYAVETLLSLKQNVPAEIITPLANNLEYAKRTHSMLIKYGKENLFPKEYATAEYLAKSDMVQWLMYPTELGKEPDEIMYIGKIKYLFKKEVYYVFKYRSDSDTLGDDLKNKWLIGWSSNDGGTFSNFDEYALFEKATIEATLKNIKKKLIG